MLDDRSTSSSLHSRDLIMDRARRPSSFRRRLAVVGVTLLLMSFMIGAAGFNHGVTHWADLTKVIAVALFVAAMIALAMGMIGDSFQSVD